MGLWNAWTALGTGLLIGTNVGMVLIALLKISGTDEPRQPEVRKKKAESFLVSTLQGDDVATTADSMDKLAGPRGPFRFH